ncbi:hypothetical protein AB3M93_20575 [Novosphingobium panipatense]
MDRDRDDDPRRLLEQARQLNERERGRGMARGGPSRPEAAILAMLKNKD